MNFLAYIPARKNSIRVKNKNILKIKKKPLIAHTLIAAKKSKFINNIYVSSDSHEVKKIVIKEGVNFYNFRKKKLSGPKITMHKLILSDCNIFIKKKIKYDYIVLLQPTSPLRTVSDIDRACKLFLKNKNEVNCLVSTTSCYRGCDISKIMYSDGKYLNFKKNRKFKIKRLRNGPAIMIVKKDKFRNSLMSGKILDFTMSNKKSIDINFYKDFEEIKKILKNEKKN